ncbi:MAG: DUF6602 domain-containing protein [Candidatus Obscuribacterales bacterium]
MLLHKHLDNLEEKLLQYFEHTSLFTASANLGPCREQFIKAFLVSHLSKRAAVSSGEIFDQSSTDDYQSRNQLDVIIYDPTFPILDFDATGISLILAESVFATIEVKSTLSEDELKRAISVSRKTKALKRNLQIRASKATLIVKNKAPYWPMGIPTFVVAYKGPTMKTLHSWLTKIHNELSIEIPNHTLGERFKHDSPSIDGVFILGQGFLLFDNNTLFSVADMSAARDTSKWLVGNQERGNLQVLFYLLSHAVSGLNLTPYLNLQKMAITMEP